MNKKRNRLEVIHSILSVIVQNRNSIKPTPLLRYSNLSSQRFNEYIKELVDKEFIKEIVDKDGRRIYSVINKGFLFLERFESIKKFISDFDL